jgi:RNA polymerase sigma factor (sigma-70 family)
MADNATGSPTRPTLLRRIRDLADTEAWQTFVDVYGPLIYRHGRGCGLQDADAAEVTQEVLLQVSRSIQQFEYDPQRGRFRDWLGTVTRNKVRRFLNREAGVQAPLEAHGEELLANLAAPVEDAEWTEAFLRHVLHCALTRIRPHFDEQHWRAFEGVWREDRPAADVAQELGQRIDWVYLAKSRILKRLQEEVKALAEDLPLSWR